MADDRALDQAALDRAAVNVLQGRIAVLELRAKGTDEDIKRLKRDLAALIEKGKE
jgi:hypothetical protein